MPRCCLIPLNHINSAAFQKHDWTFPLSRRSRIGNRNRKEVLPPDPEPRGKESVIHRFIDADCAGETVTGISCAGCIVYSNNAPISLGIPRDRGVSVGVDGSTCQRLRLQNNYH